LATVHARSFCVCLCDQTACALPQTVTEQHQYLHPPHIIPHQMLELLFVGAGPHSLATLTRILEPNPDPGVDAPQRHVNAKSKVRQRLTNLLTPWYSTAALALAPCQAPANQLLLWHPTTLASCLEWPAGPKTGSKVLQMDVILTKPVCAAAGAELLALAAHLPNIQGCSDRVAAGQRGCYRPFS
jgi:hypothetical protein